MSTAAPPASQFDIQEETGGSIGAAAREYWTRVKGGDMGSLPAIVGVVVLVVIFGIMEGDTFLSKGNFANLINQGAAIMVLAMGLVFVLLLGEIDLSAGFAAGMGAAILATTLTEHGWAWPLALLAALATGVAIGFAIAVLVARLGIPSFVVTLAFFLGLQGAMLLIIGEGGTIPIRDEAILSVMNDNMPVAPRLAVRRSSSSPGSRRPTLMRIRARRKEGLPTEAMSVWAVEGRRARRGRPDRGVAPQPGAPARDARSSRSRASRGWCRWSRRWSSGWRSCSAGRRSAATSTRSAATPRPRGGRASTCRTSRRRAS